MKKFITFRFGLLSFYFVVGLVMLFVGDLCNHFITQSKWTKWVSANGGKFECAFVDCRFQTSMVSIYDLNPSTESLEGIKGIKSLRQLSISHTQISDLTSIESSRPLRSLDLSYSNVVDLRPVKALKKLSELYLEAVPLEDLGPLSGLSNLKHVCLFKTEIEPIQLKNISHVESLCSDRLPKICMNNLKRLYLSRFVAEDLDMLELFPTLEYLYVQDTLVSKELKERLPNCKLRLNTSMIPIEESSFPSVRAIFINSKR